MKTNIKLLILFSMFIIFSRYAKADSPMRYVIDPHDSLLFDAGSVSQNILLAGKKNCYIQVKALKGTVIGEVLQKEIVPACGENETLYTSKIKELKVGDILADGSQIITSTGSDVGIGIYLSTDESEPIKFTSMYLTIGEESEMKLPRIQDLCGRLLEHPPQPEIPVIKGVVTYEDEPDAKPKFKTKGKRSSVKHTKTRYSHEVRIDGIDTIDVIRVYKGAVEVSMENIDIDEEDMTKKMEQLSEDMQSGKLTAEEMQAKMSEFQNFGQMVNELIQPLNVDQGFKCTVTKNSRVVEPLGSGDEDIK
jgi:hypothetical protein